MGGFWVVSHFEIRIALNFIASSVARRLRHRVRGSERTPLSDRFLLTLWRSSEASQTITYSPKLWSLQLLEACLCSHIRLLARRR